ncbi:unnamed protein product [Chilo suppressalis]|uniref:Centrosomal protein of 290kDa coiled-coil region domain-containing protein n=1 Tax=Chilo suppressalis TaxID=168631 RepID=A0ABN8LBR8_CHISP|nr:unnamed protein product [Chilo suppressalis]
MYVHKIIINFSTLKFLVVLQNWDIDKTKIKELQNKLSQASLEIEQSAEIIEKLKLENRRLKTISEESSEYQVGDIKNQSDENKEKLIINKLKRKVKTLSIALQEAEEMIVIRDKELADIGSQLQLIQSDEGIRSLLEGLKYKKRLLKTRDEGIKSMVREINELNQLVEDLQLENESVRIKYNVPRNEVIPTKGILKRLYESEENFKKISKAFKKIENKVTTLELENHVLKNKSRNFLDILVQLDCDKGIIEKIDKIINSSDVLQPRDNKEPNRRIGAVSTDVTCVKTCDCNAEMQAIADENEGLRKGLQEILNFLKDNSTTSSGVLTLQCPSLDAVLQSMEARHAAGWFAPHMSTVMELRAALGGKDALLTALHEARKETFGVMTQLSKETQKSTELEKKLQDIEKQQESENNNINEDTAFMNSSNSQRKSSIGEIGSWVSFEDNTIDSYTQNEIENHILKRNSSYEEYLKKGLNYFHEKFRTLFEKMTSIVVQTADQQNHWSIQEEQYKAQIQNLRAQLQLEEEEDISEDSPGLIALPNTSILDRKCSYLEESYKYIRTLNENMKNEILEGKKEGLLLRLEYETQIQKCMLVIANLFDKLRYSISIESFWKQNAILNETTTKYRELLEENCKKYENIDLIKLLEQNKSEILKIIQDNLQKDKKEEDKFKNLLSTFEQFTNEYQNNKIGVHLDEKIKLLEAQNIHLQKTQAKIIDESLAKDTKEEIDLLKSQLIKLVSDNNLLKEQCQHIGSQLDVALLELQDNQLRQFSHDIEINMLRHQILDLQASGDNKAIIARLSSEVLVAHLQTSENNKKIERLSIALNKEKQSRIEAEEMLEARQKIFDIYSMRYESKFRYIYEVMQILRQQYHGSLPIASLENYLHKMEDLTRKTYAANEKLEQIENLQYNLMTKHSVYEQVLDLTKNKCIDEQDGCAHKLKYLVLERMRSREESHCSQKLEALEKSRQDLILYCNKVENTLVLVNQGFEKPALNNSIKKDVNNKNEIDIELQDVQSDDESQSRRSRTITLSKPQALNPINKKPTLETNISQKPKIAIPTETKEGSKVTHKFVQTECENSQKFKKISKSIQTAPDDKIIILEGQVRQLKSENENINSDLYNVKNSAYQKAQDIINLNSQKLRLEAQIQNMKDLNSEKEKLNKNLRNTIDELKEQIEEHKISEITEKNKVRDAANEENKSLILALKQLESDKNNIVAEYKKLLQTERDQYSKSMKDFNRKLVDLQSKLDSKESDTTASKSDAVKEVISKYTLKIENLEDTYFKTKSELESSRTEMMTYQSELERWKELAIERLAKMEQLSSQLEERHCHEVESYKAENQHWLSQLNETQREHLELRTRLSEQKTLHMKQLADKDSIIEQLRSSVHNLKTQILSMQTMISVNDPSFDLSAIVEVDETSDGLSQLGSERLELKFDSAVDIHEMQDDLTRMPVTSTAIWQEPVLERLRREKQLASKQNAILRRQIKALAARERRARLDAQNLKNQVFRISTSGSRVATAETAALQSKIASLQAQLISARRDTHSSITLWDKWKRAQQSSDRWQARYEDKCQEVKKMESSMNLAKSAVVRLEKEKRVLLARLADEKQERQLTIEKQDMETLEKSSRLTETERSVSPLPVPERALLDRVQAQQRRIAALEVAEKGNETLISEYERELAEITSLKGQVLKLESTLLESQIRTPIKTKQAQPELEYWKSYCDMLKEENVQLNIRVNALETTPTTANQHRVNDLEQTVLTLRGLVGKLQAEQKSTAIQKRGDSRPGSGKSTSDKGRIKHVDTYRIEIANLKRSIEDKDLLLEKSKEMLKIAAEREDELLRENVFLRRRLEELTSPKAGFLSA